MITDAHKAVKTDKFSVVGQFEKNNFLEVGILETDLRS